MATPRVLRRLESARVVDSLSPSLRACANDGALTAPASFALTVAVGPDGSVESAEVARDARLPSTVVACVVKAVTAARFGAPGVAGATAILPVTVPARAAAPATPAPMTTAVAVGSSASQAATPRAELHAVVAAAVVSTNP